MKRLTLSLGLIAVMVLGVQMSFNTTSFPGFHGGTQCGVCHNEPASAWNGSWGSEAITLDGLMDEPFWAERDDGSMYVPVGIGFGFMDSYDDENGTHIEVPNFIHLNFAQNTTHLFIHAIIEDHTQTGSASFNAAGTDGFAMLWNIDQDEFKLPDASSNFGPGNYYDNWMSMDGDNLEGGTQDLVFWSPSASAQSAPSFNTTSKGFDNSTVINDETWDKNYGGTASENQDWSSGASHGKENSRSDNGYYQVELARPLVTDDDNDVQFQFDGYYEFAIATWNDTKGAMHSVSFEHTLWVHGAEGAEPLDTVTADGTTETVTETGAGVTVTETEESDSPFNSLLSFFGLISISFAVMVYRRKD